MNSIRVLLTLTVIGPEAARVGAGYADLAGEVPRLLRGRIDPEVVLAADQFHPGAEAYAAWAEVIAAALPAEALGGETQSADARLSVGDAARR